MSELPDVLAPDLDIVFCGTAPGRESARRQAYYAGAGNLFWPTLYKVGLTPTQLEAENFRYIKRYGLGLTDLAKHASGCDKKLSRSDFSSTVLLRKLRKYRPRILAFTSKRAAREFFGCRVDYGRIAEPIEDVILFVL